jgi:hypothetical protein
MRRQGGGSGRPGATHFWAALWFAALLTAALVWLLATPEWADAAAGPAYRILLWSLRAWTALAWGAVIIAGLRLLRRP